MKTILRDKFYREAERTPAPASAFDIAIRRLVVLALVSPHVVERQGEKIASGGGKESAQPLIPRPACGGFLWPLAVPHGQWWLLGLYQCAHREEKQCSRETMSLTGLPSLISGKLQHPELPEFSFCHLAALEEVCMAATAFQDVSSRPCWRKGKPWFGNQIRVQRREKPSGLSPRRPALSQKYLTLQNDMSKPIETFAVEPRAVRGRSFSSC